jgi:hypothetical protein
VNEGGAGGGEDLAPARLLHKPECRTPGQLLPHHPAAAHHLLVHLCHSTVHGLVLPDELVDVGCYSVDLRVALRVVHVLRTSS